MMHLNIDSPPISLYTQNAQKNTLIFSFLKSVKIGFQCFRGGLICIAFQT